MIQNIIQEARKGSAEQQNMLGHFYLLGCLVEKDKKKSAYWFKKSAEQGFADSQFSLGLCYHAGCGVDTDMAKAVCWYRKSAKQGNSDAHHILLRIGC